MQSSILAQTSKESSISDGQMINILMKRLRFDRDSCWGEWRWEYGLDGITLKDVCEVHSEEGYEVVVVGEEVYVSFVPAFNASLHGIKHYRWVD